MKILIAASIILASTASAQAADAPLIPHFTEETKTAGINSVYAGDWQYMVGGGVATFDCNGDNYPDLLLAGGEKPANFYRNTSKHGGTLRFKQQRSGLELDKVTGAYPIDVDSDGIMDVVLLRVGENKVMRGRGNCQFEEANTIWNFDGGDAWSTALAAEWESKQQWPTIAIGNYIDRTKEDYPWGSCTDNWLHRPDGLKFGKPIPLKQSYCALSMLFTDWNRSGTKSLRVSNDREYYEGGQEQMWRVDPGKNPHLYTQEDGWKFVRIWGMGIATTDLNGDAYPDYFLTSMADSRLQVLTNSGPGKPDYSEISYSKGLTAHRPYTGKDLKPSTGWHAEFADVNNDTLMDLFIAKGNVDRMPDFAQHDPNNLLLQGSDGKFLESGDKAGVASMQTSRGAAVVDLNLDGLLDLVVVNRRTTAQVWRNTTKNAGHWVEIKLHQDGLNLDAIGARIEVRAGGSLALRDIAVGGGHASGESGWWHFGLGENNEAETRITWPDGTVGPWQQIAADQFYIAESNKPLRTQAIK